MYCSQKAYCFLDFMLTKMNEIRANVKLTVRTTLTEPDAAGDTSMPEPVMLAHLWVKALLRTVR